MPGSRHALGGWLERAHESGCRFVNISPVREDLLDSFTGEWLSAWFDPEHPSEPGSPCLHGNPNVLTKDVGTSSLAQGPTAHTCMVEVEVAVDPPAPTAFRFPDIIR